MFRSHIAKLALSTLAAAASFAGLGTAGAASASATSTAPVSAHTARSSEPAVRVSTIRGPDATWNWGTACWSTWMPLPVYNEQGGQDQLALELGAGRRAQRCAPGDPGQWHHAEHLAEDRHHRMHLLPDVVGHVLALQRQHAHGRMASDDVAFHAGGQAGRSTGAAPSADPDVPSVSTFGVASPFPMASPGTVASARSMAALGSRRAPLPTAAPTHRPAVAG